MYLSVEVSVSLLTAATVAAARQATSVDSLVRRAIAEYLLDLDAGLLSSPARETRIVARQRDMVARVRRRR